MALSEWIMIALMAVIIITAVILFLYFRHKLRSHEDFEGIVTEHGEDTHRAEIEVQDEIEKLETYLKKGP